MLEEKKQTNENRQKESPDFFSYENLKSLAILLLIIFAIRSSITSPYHVPTSSMEPTIKVGDRLLAWKLSYDLKFPFTDFSLLKLGDIKRGDIIVFRYPKDPSIDYVKRAVGLPGDKIKIIDDVIYINSIPQKRINFDHNRKILEDIKDDSTYKNLYKETLHGIEHWTMNIDENWRPPSRRNWPEGDGYYTVPKDSYFVLGDNRDNSLDSREWRCVPKKYVKGKAKVVLWSMYTTDDAWWKPIFRFTRFGHILK